MFELRNTVFVNTTAKNKVYFHRPRIGNVALNSCVDMACDGARRLFIKDMDGTFTSESYLGREISVFAQSEYQWEGVTGFDWSQNVDVRWGLGDYRIPESMLTYTNGTVISADEYAPHKGRILKMLRSSSSKLMFWVFET